MNVAAWVVTLIVAFALGAEAAASDCRREPPLPADVRVIAPIANVPPAVAQFSGTWVGAWKDRGGADVQCNTLVVEEVFPNGFVRVVYSAGASEAWKIPQPEFWRVTGRVADGALRFRLRTQGGGQFAYRVDGGALVGTFNGGGDLRVIRIPDPGQVGCRFTAGAPSPPAGGPRDRITRSDLSGPTYVGTGPVHNDYFAPVGPAAPARHALRGRLTTAATLNFTGNRGCPGLTIPDPGATLEVITHGEHLVPVVRGILTPGNWIVSPGRVWSEPGDQGMSRAAFPFVVVDERDNSAHNGLAMFLFDNTRVSSLRFQIVQETAEWAKFDFWGQAPMTYAPGPVADEATVRARFAAELRHEVPIRPWSALPARGPVIDGFDGDARPEDISANGLIVDGVVYVRGCNTRYGAFPYCRHMRHGVFSVTKSLAAAVALLRLAEKYGDAIFDLKIKDYVPVTAPHDGWADVTFADALNMATGIGDLSPRREPNHVTADENKPKMFEWMKARTAKDKLDIGFTYGKYPWPRGEVVRYNSLHTFILAAAMDALVKRREGPDTHLWDVVTREVYEPLGIFHAPMMHTLETDGRRGIPLLAYGLYPTIDDVAKLVSLLQGRGRHERRQLLHGAKVAEALHPTGREGLGIGLKNRFGERRYHLSFWSAPYRTATGCSLQIPYMLGLGGNFVVLLPNGVAAFRFADGNNYDLESMVLAGEAIRPLCASPPAATAPSPARPAPLTASELAAALSGNTFYGPGVHVYIDPGGVLYAAAGESVDVGRWEITPDGLYCSAWNVGDGGRRRCASVHRQGETFEFLVHDGWSVTPFKRTPGNAERY